MNDAVEEKYGTLISDACRTRQERSLMYALAGELETLRTRVEKMEKGSGSPTKKTTKKVRS